MQINTLRIANFRCFEDVELALAPGFNVVIGNNASGKTALLEAAAVALGGWISGIGGFESRPLDAKKDVRRVSHWYDTEFTSEPQVGTEVLADGEFPDGGGVWTRFLNKRGSTVEGGWNVSANADNASLRVRKGEALTLPVVAYYGAGRFAGEPTTTRTTRTSLDQLDLSRLEGYRNAITGGRISPRVLKLWIEYQDRIAYSERRESPLYSAVRSAIASMIPGAEQTRYDPKTEEIVLVFEKEVARPFSELSDGQRGLSALAGDIAVRMCRLNPHMGMSALIETPGVVLIDELDLHLHPEWQRHVVADLRRTFPRVQFIATTHSPQIIGEVEPQCVIPLENYRVAEHPAQSKGMDTNFILRNVMHASERQRGTTVELRALEALIGNELYESAQEGIDALRASVGPFPELTSLQTRIDRIRLLGDKR